MLYAVHGLQIERRAVVADHAVIEPDGQQHGLIRFHAGELRDAAVDVQLVLAGFQLDDATIEQIRKA